MLGYDNFFSVREGPPAIRIRLKVAGCKTLPELRTVLVQRSRRVVEGCEARLSEDDFAMLRNRLLAMESKVTSI
jgi:hypothetical protein